MWESTIQAYMHANNSGFVKKGGSGVYMEEVFNQGDTIFLLNLTQYPGPGLSSKITMLSLLIVCT